MKNVLKRSDGGRSFRAVGYNVAAFIYRADKVVIQHFTLSTPELFYATNKGSSTHHLHGTCSLLCNVSLSLTILISADHFSDSKDSQSR